MCGSDGQTYSNACLLKQKSCFDNSDLSEVGPGTCDGTVKSEEKVEENAAASEKEEETLQEKVRREVHAVIIGVSSNYCFPLIIFRLWALQ